MSVAAPPKPITPDDVLAMGDAGKGFELVHGELKELAVSRKSSHIAGEIHGLIRDHCKVHQPVWLFPENTAFCCFADDPRRLRKPDTSVVLRHRMTAEEYDDPGCIPTVPDLVVEVISPTDVADEVEEKIDEWLTAGVPLLWEVYPNTRVVRVHRPGQPIAVYRGTDTITGDSVLPGFSCPVSAFFEIPPGP